MTALPGSSVLLCQHLYHDANWSRRKGLSARAPTAHEGGTVYWRIDWGGGTFWSIASDTLLFAVRLKSVVATVLSIYPCKSLPQTRGENSVVSHTTMSSRPRKIL